MDRYKKRFMLESKEKLINKINKKRIKLPKKELSEEHIIKLDKIIEAIIILKDICNCNGYLNDKLFNKHKLKLTQLLFSICVNYECSDNKVNKIGYMNHYNDNDVNFEHIIKEINKNGGEIEL